MTRQNKQPPRKRSTSRTTREKVLSIFPKNRRLLGQIIVVAMVVGLVANGVVVATMLTPGSESEPGVSNTSTMLPGAQYTGIVNAQQAEVTSGYHTQRFELQLTNATGTDEHAAVIAAEVDAIRRTLSDLETGQETIKHLQTNGTVNQSVYRARVTDFVSQSRVLERRITRTKQAATALSAETRKEYGITTAVFERLGMRADDLTTPQLVEIARTVAGNDIGQDLNGSDNRQLTPTSTPQDDDTSDTDDEDENGERSETDTATTTTQTRATSDISEPTRTATSTPPSTSTQTDDEDDSDGEDRD